MTAAPMETGVSYTVPHYAGQRMSDSQLRYAQGVHRLRGATLAGRRCALPCTL